MTGTDRKAPRMGEFFMRQPLSNGSAVTLTLGTPLTPYEYELLLCAIKELRSGLVQSGDLP